MAYQDETFILMRIVNRITIAIIISFRFIELFINNKVQARTIDIIIIFDVIFKFFNLEIPRVIHK